MNLQFLENLFFETYKIPKTYIEYTCGIDDDEQYCPDDETECKDCPNKAIEINSTKITDKQWLELIYICGNAKMIKFPYKDIEEMKEHVLQIIINSHKYPPIKNVIQKLFLTENI